MRPKQRIRDRWVRYGAVRRAGPRPGAESAAALLSVGHRSFPRPMSRPSAGGFSMGEDQERKSDKPTLGPEAGLGQPSGVIERNHHEAADALRGAVQHPPSDGKSEDAG